MFTFSINRMLAAAGLLGAGLLASGSALALVMGPPQTTFYFTGVCADCLPSTPPDIGTLVLEGYTPGDAITDSNFVAFAYNGSDLVFPFTVTRSDISPFLGVGTDYLYYTGTSDTVAGAIPAAGGAAAFRVIFQDGIGFGSTAAGAWYACAPGGAGYSSGSCTQLHNNDFGTGGWSATAPVPEPASFALMGMGVLGLLALRRRQATQ